MRLAVYATPFRSDRTALAGWRLIELALSKGDEVRLASDAVDAFCDKGIDIDSLRGWKIWRGAKVPRLTDFVISLGGDGTFLRAAHWSGDYQIPVAGINLGHLGYLPAFTDSDIDTILEILRSGEFDIESRSMLAVDIPAGLIPHDEQPWLQALNEVAILKQDTASMISIPVSADNHELGVYRADGLIISTPTGSTGYSLSVGGPVLQPTVPALVLSPIADHSLTMRPMVINDNTVLVTTAQGRATSFRVSLDGKSFTLPSGTPVKIYKAPFCCRIVCRKESMFSATLRSKLLWGESRAIDRHD